MREVGARMHDDQESITGDHSPIRAILFDKDGTLVDFERTWGPAVDAVLRHLASGNDALYHKLAAASGFDPSTDCFRPDSPLIGQPTSVFARPIASLLGRPADTAFLTAIDQLLCAATTRNLTPIDDPKTVLGQLAARSYRLGLITNDAEATARAHARKLGIAPLLAFIAGYDSGFGAKPDAGPVLAFAAAVGVSPAEIVVVGDTVLDVATARSAGTQAVVVLTGPAPFDRHLTKADGVIPSLAALAVWLDSGRPALREH